MPHALLASALIILLHLQLEVAYLVMFHVKPAKLLQPLVHPVTLEAFIIPMNA